MDAMRNQESVSFIDATETIHVIHQSDGQSWGGDMVKSFGDANYNYIVSGLFGIFKFGRMSDAKWKTIQEGRIEIKDLFSG